MKSVEKTENKLDLIIVIRFKYTVLFFIFT